MYDIIIKGGKVIDGTGNEMFSGDVGIKEDKIKDIGDLHNDTAETVIDASGKYVCPGFIDVNNHSDTYWRIFLDESLKSLLYQGITTMVGGNCGSSLAPLVDKDVIYSIQKWADINKVSFNWLKMKEFLDEVGNKKIPLNFATLVGHSTLRRGFLRDEERKLNSDEARLMKRMLRVALKDGAIGLSSGLVYSHAKTAPEEEIFELVEIVSKYKGVYATHMKEESQDLIKSLESAIRLSREAKVSLHISHLKVIGEENWPLMERALEMIESAKRDGLDITFDVYPYTFTGSVLYSLLPDWVSKGGKRMMIQRLKDSEIRKTVVKEMEDNIFDYSKVIVSISSLDKTMSRKKITEIAASQGKTVEEAIVDILIASDGRVIVMMDALSEENIEKAIGHPQSIISSNGSGYNEEHGETGELVHPRNFGSFPKVLSKYVRDKKILSWEQAINKMSGKPAEKFGIKKRGIIKKENFADVVVFDPDKIRGRATIENPYQYSEGVEWVLVNGKPVLHEGRFSGERSGKVIRRNSL